MPQTISPESSPDTSPAATSQPRPSSPQPQPAILQSQLDALLTSAGLVSLKHTGWIKITGSDRVRWLNGMVTNSLGDLTPGAGCYNFFLNAQGRIQGDGYVFAEPDHLLLQTASSQIPPLTTLLDRFIVMDDVELTDLSPDISPARKGLLIAGPHAPEILRTLDLLQPDLLHPDALSPAGPPPALAHILWRDDNLTVIHAYSPLVPRFEIWADEPALSTVAAELLARDAIHSTPEALDHLRILEGTPLFGTDIRDRDLPQETAATRALHFSKGCYLGQEIVERIRSRGQVHRTFGGFRLHGTPATPGTPLLADMEPDQPGKPVGELTSVATLALPSGGNVQLALGYIRREALALPIHYVGGTAHPAPLPFHLTKGPDAPTHI